MNRLAVILLMCVALITASCEHKELALDDGRTLYMPVRYDWRNAPDAQPGSMAAVFFDQSGQQEPLYYSFSGRKGGNIRLTVGNYHAIGFNNDNDSWVCFRNTGDVDTYELYTIDAPVLQAFGLTVARLPRATEDERVAQAPEMIWNHRVSDFSLTRQNYADGITFYPEEAVCHYTVTVLDVENLKYVAGKQLDATVSGLAEGFLHGSHAPTDVPVTMPLILTASSDNQSLYGEFLNFGDCSSASQDHILTIYVVFDDGSASYYTYDVTDQVRYAPDPRHVDIVVRGLHLPKPIVNGGGLHPDVEQWQHESIDLDM